MDNSTAAPTESKATTPKKRRHSEYHDPDYGPDYYRSDIGGEDNKDKDHERKIEGITSPKITANNESVAKLKRIETIVNAEFQKELHKKEQQLNEIDERLYKARQLLDRLRYQVVSEYYKKQQVTLTAADVARVRSGDTHFGDGLEPAGVQLPLHPAVKKIVGKRPTSIPLNLPERSAATLAKQTIRLRNPANRRAERRRQQKIREQGIVTNHSQENENQENPSTSKQAYTNESELKSSVSALNASRLNNKSKYHFVIGNTSKYLGRADLDAKSGQSLTYKWLVYVQGKNLPQPLDAYLKKVRFQLHHSYRPNDIVDVHSPPFQLTRRGWGEFPMRIQLYFQNHLHQKPVQLMHNIVLDKTMCGLHTMGAETTVEVWLRADWQPSSPTMTQINMIKQESSDNTSSPLVSDSNSKPRTISITQNKEDLDDNLFACVSNIEICDDIDHIEPTVLVSEPLKLISSSTKEITEPGILCRTQFQNDSMSSLADGSSSPSSVFPSKNDDDVNKKDTTIISQVRKGWSTPQVKNVVFQKEGKLYIIDPIQSKLKQAVKQQSLLKPQLSLLKRQKHQISKRWHILQCIQNDHGYANMGIREVALEPEAVSQSLSLDKLFRRIPFHSMRSAVEFLLRRLPLVAESISGSSNILQFPFASRTLTAFQGQSALRQRFFEFMRARILLRCMREHVHLQHLHWSGKESFWSTREIVAYARLHGYTPPLKMLTINKQIHSAIRPLAERVQEQLQENCRSELMDYCSLTAKSRLDKWITKRLEILESHQQLLHDQEIIEVVSPLPSCSLVRGLQKFTNPLNQRVLYLPPPDEFDAATQLVRDMCKDIGIILHTEQSVPGVSQALALTVLASILRIFIEKLVRRAIAAKLRLQQQSHLIETLPFPAANLELTLLPHDIGRVLDKCAELDFLGNSYLGVEHKVSQSDS